MHPDVKQVMAATSLYGAAHIMVITLKAWSQTKTVLKQELQMNGKLLGDLSYQ